MAEAHRTTLRRILAASDLSEDSDRALEAAASLAAAAAAELHVLHCVAQPVFPYWEGLVDPTTREQWVKSAHLDLEWQVRRVLGTAPAVASIRVRVGEAPREIGAAAAECGADLIVLGPHQPRAAFDDLLGTTADRLIRSAALPCLLANRPLRLPLRRVLMATDFSAPATHALEVALDMLGTALLAGGDAQERTAIELLFVSAYALASRPVAAQARLVEQVERAKDRLPPEAAVEILPRILSTPLPVEGIRRAGERMEADLLVMGTHGYGTLGRALIGSVASAVARTVPFPLLLVPPPEP